MLSMETLWITVYIDHPEFYHYLIFVMFISVNVVHEQHWEWYIYCIVVSVLSNSRNVWTDSQSQCNGCFYVGRNVVTATTSCKQWDKLRVYHYITYVIVQFVPYQIKCSKMIWVFSDMSSVVYALTMKFSCHIYHIDRSSC